MSTSRHLTTHSTRARDSIPFRLVLCHNLECRMARARLIRVLGAQRIKSPKASIF
jgi:hypothetical protein